MKTKIIFITGGVLSSLGKGVAAAAIGALLESRGLRITFQKLDPYINGLILGTNHTDSITVGDQIFIQSGERASIYNTVRDNNLVGTIRYIPVVPDNFPNGAFSEVLAYVPFQITDVIGSGNNPSVIGHFVPGWVDPHAKGGGGKNFGDLMPPKLVN